MNVTRAEKKEKDVVTISSIIAAVFLTSMKLFVGIITGSLGILSEALHSGLDLVAAVMTYFAVKIADKPADSDHQYGHGKVENLSALGETLLLFITCLLIVYEAVKRIFFEPVSIDINGWSFGIIIVSVIVDLSRSRALKRVAIKYNSQALEADALHFSTDIYSSLVVIIGLIGVKLNFHKADPIAALIVAVLVISISYRLGKKSIDVLLDKSPRDIIDKVRSLSKEFPDITYLHDLRTRTSGSQIFVDMNIHVDSALSVEKAHAISEKFEERIKENIHKAQVHIHIEPEEVE